MKEQIPRREQNTNALRWSTFIALYIGYTMSILNRKAFSFVLPNLMLNLGFQKSEAGLISSSQNLAYTISKFVGGILCDIVDIKYLFCIGLFCSGLLTTSLSVFQTSGIFVVILFLQGIFQGGLWPACAKTLKQNLTPDVFNFYWGLLATSMNIACAAGPILTSFLLAHTTWRMFSPSEFGTWYAVLNTGMNVACCLGPLVFTLIVSRFQWPSAFIFSGVSATLGSVLVFFMMGDLYKKHVDDTGSTGSKLTGRGSWRDLVASPFLWVVALSYFVIFMTRTAALDWGQLYVIQELGQSSYVGSLFTSSLELGGVVGSVSAGVLADYFVSWSHSCSATTTSSQHSRDNLRGTPRMTVALLFVALLTASLHSLLFFLSTGSSQLMISLVGFFIGVGVYGPISIYGVMSMEASPVHLQSTAHAIVSLVANVGAVMAGLPFSMVAGLVDWKGAFVVLEAMLVVVMVTKTLTRNLEYKTVSIKKKMQ